MDPVNQLIDGLPVDEVIKSLQKLTQMGWGGFAFTFVLTVGVIALKIWWDRNKARLNQERTEHERNKERGNTATENQSGQEEWNAAEQELARKRAEAAGLPEPDPEGTRVDIPKPKRPQPPEEE
jgi:hypothetical protein